MIRILLVLSLLSIYIKASSSEPVVMPGKASVSPIQELYDACGLKGKLSFDAFQKCLEGFTRYKPAKSIIAICDFSKPSDQKRFFVIDLIQKKTLAYTYVAHGKNSGEKMATSFSNQPESLKSSLGFLVGQPIETLKHGMSLILDGLEKGKTTMLAPEKLLFMALLMFPINLFNSMVIPAKVLVARLFLKML